MTHGSGPRAGGYRYPLFAAICLIWGSTWLAMKIGLAYLEPLTFAGVRFFSAGLLLVTALALARQLTLPRGKWRIAVVGAFLMITANYGGLFWGTARVASGLAAVINLSLIPIFLYGLAVLHGQERASVALMRALALGVVGLSVLFAPRLAFGGSREEILGMLAVAGGTLAYCWGTILSRPLMEKSNPYSIGGLHTLIGGVGLLVASFALEGGGVERFRAILIPQVLGSLGFLVIFGSLIAFSGYLLLVRDWGASRAGLYAFLSPVVAVVLGVLVLSEPLTPTFVIGGVLLLSGAALAFRVG